LPAELTFDTGYFAVQATAVAAADIKLGGAGDAIVIGGDGFDTAAEHVEHSVQVAFDQGAHGVELIFQTGLVDDVQALGDGRTDAFAGAERRDTEFEKDHDEQSDRLGFNTKTFDEDDVLAVIGL
jgi:hypothetical protein